MDLDNVLQVVRAPQTGGFMATMEMSADFIIWYTDDKGKQQNFRFTGSNTDGAPKNEFVQQFLSAYK